MAQIISLHSFRGGTGKSNTTANLATLFAAEGRRVGVIDTDIQTPGIHVLFGLRGPQITHALNDYLWGRCAVADIAQPVLQDVLPVLSLGASALHVPAGRWALLRPLEGVLPSGRVRACKSLAEACRCFAHASGPATISTS